jgi:hypothetical protein
MNHKISIFTSKVLLFGLFILSIVGGVARADNAVLRKLAFYAVQQTSCTASADGRLADECWAQAPVASHFYEYWKLNPAPSPVKTSFQMLYDDRGLYLKITNVDDHLDKLRASIIRPDDPELWTNDCATIYIDPQANGVGFLNFTINSLGVQSDFKQQDAAVALNDWSAYGWRAFTHNTSDAWIIEAFFPWADLGKQAKAGDVWMFDPVRYAYSSGKFIGSTWAPGGNYKSTTNFGYLYFMKDKTISSETVAKVLNAAAPAPWMLPLGNQVLVHSQPEKMEFTSADAMAAANRSALQHTIARAKDVSQNDAAAQKELAQIDAAASAISYKTSMEALDAVDKMAELQQQADQIYWQQQINNLVDEAAASPLK